MVGMTPWEVIEQALARRKPKPQSQEWLANELSRRTGTKITPQAISHWKGKRGVPKGRFFDLADLLGLTPDQVAGRAPVPWEKETGWPFPGIDEGRYTPLLDSQKEQIQEAVIRMIEGFERAKPRASGKY